SEAWTGKHTLVTDSRELVAQVLQQMDFYIVSRGKVAVSTFTGEGAAPGAIPIETSFSQACAGGDQRGVSAGDFDGVEMNKILGLEVVDAPSMCVQIIDEPHIPGSKLPGNFSGIRHPRQVGRFDFSIQDGTCDSEAGSIHLAAVLS